MALRYKDFCLSNVGPSFCEQKSFVLRGGWHGERYDHRHLALSAARESR
jgi:hypothetical protein